MPRPKPTFSPSVRPWDEPAVEELVALAVEVAVEKRTGPLTRVVPEEGSCWQADWRVFMTVRFGYPRFLPEEKKWVRTVRQVCLVVDERVAVRALAELGAEGAVVTIGIGLVYGLLRKVDGEAVLYGSA